MAMSDTNIRPRFGSRWGDFVIIAIIGVVIAVTIYALLPGNVYYSIAARNYTNEGIIIYSAAQKTSKKKNGSVSQWRIHPGIPGVGADIVRISAYELFDVPQVSKSESYSYEMPEQFRVRWQRAELSNCNRSVEGTGYKTKNGRRVELDDGKIYVRRRRCDWEPYGPIRTFSVSRTRIRSSDAYEAVDNAHSGYMSGPPVLDVTFIFDAEGVHVETGWGFSR